MRQVSKSALLAAVVIALTTAVVWAAFVPYSQDFEGLIQGDTAALADDGWIVFGNVYDAGGGYIYGYGSFPAPNDGGAFCQIAAGEGGAPQGAQQLVVFSDYNNPDHLNFPDRIIEANVFQQQMIEAGDVGLNVVFTFDAKMGDLIAPSTALAFIKTIDPNNGFVTTNFVTEDMTTIPSTWGTYSIQLSIDSGLVGQLLQFGFSASASNYNSSGVFYDNVNVQDAVVPTPTPTSNPSGGGNPIPTMNLWGVLTMMAMLLGIATLIIIRRK